MAVVGKLTARRVQTAKPGKIGDGGGLWLTTLPSGAKYWSFRYQMTGGRPREMGLGSEADVTLAEAREAARENRRLIRAGIDPMAHRDAERAEQRGMAFADVAALYIEAHADTGRNEKHRAQWGATLRAYVFPKIGSMGVNQIGVGDVLAVLEPIWRDKPETASRVRGRIESVLDYAAARHWRTGDNPARWSGHLETLLPERAKLRKVQHHAALPWLEMPGFMDDLAKQPGSAARALAFTILTAARTNETLGATWAEIDLSARLWTIPAERMKNKREHRVPLSGAAMAILAEMVAYRRRDTSPVFPSPLPGKALSGMAMSAVLKRMGRDDVTVHGFRSTFRDWAAEATAYERDVAEMALAHTVANRVEAAYRRGELIEKRARLMQDWAAYAEGRSVPAGEVVPIRRGR